MQQLKTILLLILFSVPLSCSAASEADAQKYWDKFRAASLISDYAALNELISFPLEVKGASDDMPIEKYEKKDLHKIFPILMSQTLIQYQGDDKYQYIQLQDIVKNTLKVNVAASETEFSVEQFNFQLIKGKWYLVRAYLEN